MGPLSRHKQCGFHPMIVMLLIIQDLPSVSLSPSWPVILSDKATTCSMVLIRLRNASVIDNPLTRLESCMETRCCACDR